MLELRINFVLSIITILMVIDHCISMKPMIALQFPLWLLNPQSNPIFAPKKGMRGPKRRLSQIHIGMDFLQKKTCPYWSILATVAQFTFYRSNIEGGNPVPCLSTQIAVRRGTAMYKDLRLRVTPRVAVPGPERG